MSIRLLMRKSLKMSSTITGNLIYILFSPNECGHFPSWIRTPFFPNNSSCIIVLYINILVLFLYHIPPTTTISRPPPANTISPSFFLSLVFVSQKLCRKGTLRPSADNEASCPVDKMLCFVSLVNLRLRVKWPLASSCSHAMLIFLRQGWTAILLFLFFVVLKMYLCKIILYYCYVSGFIVDQFQSLSIAQKLA